MTAKSNFTTFDAMLKDMFPLPSQPVKPWVLKARAERAELERTGKRVHVEPHLDNTGMPCREVGPASLVDDLFSHDCCYICGEHGERIRRIESGALPRILEGADWQRYVDGWCAPIWAGWLGMWRDILELRARAFEADRVMFGRAPWGDE